MTSYGEARLTGAPRTNFVDDLTGVSGLILAFGILVFLPATVDLISESDEGIDWDGSDGVFPPILRLIGNTIRTLFGLTSVFLGFQYVVCRWGSKLGSLMGLAITLAAWFPFLVTIAFIAFQAKEENVGGGGPLQIPYPVSKGEINAIAIMAILGFYGYAGTVIGALTFLHWKMYRFFAGYANTYSAAYYRSRLSYYGGLTIMVGIVQLALGAYVKDKFGDGELAAPIVAGPFFILFPELSITTGLCQLLLGLFIVYRSTTAGVGPNTGNKDSGLFVFQCVAWFVFIVSAGCQVFGQLSLSANPPGGLFMANVVGFAIFPMYLDVMAHTTPENITSDMFSTTKTLQSGA